MASDTGSEACVPAAELLGRAMVGPLKRPAASRCGLASGAWPTARWASGHAGSQATARRRMQRRAQALRVSVACVRRPMRKPRQDISSGAGMQRDKQAASQRERPERAPCERSLGACMCCGVESSRACRAYASLRGPCSLLRGRRSNGSTGRKGQRGVSVPAARAYRLLADDGCAPGRVCGPELCPLRARESCPSKQGALLVPAPSWSALALSRARAS